MKRFFLLSALAALAFSTTNCNNDNGLINALLRNVDDGAAPAVSDPDPILPEDGGECGTLPNPPLAGTKWKLVGIEDIKTGALTELEPKDCERCYTLAFDTDTAFSTFSSANTSHGTYNANYLAITDDYLSVARGKISFKIGVVTKAGGPYLIEESQYWDILEAVDSFSLGRIPNRLKGEYSLPQIELKLYYDGSEKYLLFRPQQSGDIVQPATEPPPPVLPPEQTLAPGKWEVVGLVDAKTGSLTELEPKGSGLYVLAFYTDTDFFSWSPDGIRGSYSADYVTHSIKFTANDGYSATGIGDAALWRNTLLSVETFSLQEDDLKLYYNGSENYALLKLLGGKNDSPPPKPALGGTKWKLRGVVDAETGLTTDFEPADCGDCYTLAFDEGERLSAHSVVNGGSGVYDADYETSQISITNLFRTMVGLEIVGDSVASEFEDQWWRILDRVESFSLEHYTLVLYYDGNKKQLHFYRL